jgi:UDP-galactopyranose mutase
MPELPLVSALVAAYNAEPFVAEALHSALAQDWPADRLEIVVVDDGSADGYTALFERLLDHPRIEVRTGAGYESVRDAYRHLVWTGPVDDYFGRRYGALPYRSLRFVSETHATPAGGLVQPVAVINHPDEATPYTRVTEYRHLTGQRHTASTLHYEIPSAEGDPYYPVPRPENRRLYERYAALAATERDVTFVGRLARYQYLNMDQVVAQALATFASTFGREPAHV